MQPLVNTADTLPETTMTTNGWRSQILTTTNRDRWRTLVEAVPQCDAFFLPEYLLLFEGLSNEPAQLFFFGNQDNYIIYPFFVRRINDLPFYQAEPLNGSTDYFDIVSPYGYSGPLAHMQDKSIARELWQGFLQAFRRYCQTANIICEFARLNPFASNQRWLEQLTGGVLAHNEITYVDLRQSEEQIWGGFNRGNRSNINKARRNGVTVTNEVSPENVARFYHLYCDTMRRNQADDWYFFSEKFFADSFRLLAGQISLLSACRNDQVIAAASFLHTGRTVHYFLGGSDPSALKLRPNNLLMFEAISQARQAGFQYFNLGGGYGAGSNLAQFKAGFSRLSTTFYTYRAIHHPQLYQALCHRHAAYHGQPEKPASSNGYFPSYRARYVT